MGHLLQLSANPGQLRRAAQSGNKENEMTRAVIVTTEYRGVFFGHAEDTSGDTIKLTNARNCIYWPSANGGFLGLAKTGPVKGARIGETVSEIELRKVTSVVEVSEEAAKAWEGFDVYRG